MPEIDPDNDLTVLTFTGQGAQHSTMTAPFRANPIYNPYMETFHSITGVDPYEDFSEEVLRTGKYTQPANVLVSVMSYVAIKESGITPNIVMGHSLGELSAVHAVGSLDPQVAIELGFYRGDTTTNVFHNLRERFRINTAMFPLVLKDNVHLPEELWPYIKRVSSDIMDDFNQKRQKAGEEVTIWNPEHGEYGGEHFLQPANQNTRVQGIISGTKEAIDHLAANLPDIFRRQRPLAVDGAFHCIAVSSGKKLYLPHVMRAGIVAPNTARLISPTTVSELTTRSSIEQMLINQLDQPVLYEETQRELLIEKMLGEYCVNKLVVLEAGPAPSKYIDDPTSGVLTNINRENIGVTVKRPQDGEEIPVEYYRVSNPLE